MNPHLLFDFSVDKEKHAITVRREFAAEVSLVWDAFTKSEILDQWWAPQPWKAQTKTMDFREGGRWHYAMIGPEGEEHWALATYGRINPKDYFMATDGFADADGNVNTELPQSRWEVSFTDQGDTTLVQNLITFDDLAQLEITLQTGFSEGLAAAMQGLDELLESLKIRK